MAESRSKRPRACNSYWSPDSSNSAVSGSYFLGVNNVTGHDLIDLFFLVQIEDRIGRNRSSKNREKIKPQRTEKDRQLSDSLNMESSYISRPADSSVMDSKEVLKQWTLIDKSSKCFSFTFTEINR